MICTRLPSTLAFMLALWSTSVRAAVARPVTFAMQVGFMVVNNLIFFVFWLLLFDRVPNIRGHALADVAVLFGVVGTGYGLAATFAGGMRHIAQAVDEGDLDGFLSQPKPALLYALGARIHPSGIGDAISGVALIVLSGNVALSNAPFVVLAILVSSATFIASNVMIQSSAFWLGKTDGIARQLLELLITFSLYPERLFGGLLRIVLFTVVPAAYVGYLPARFAQAPSPSVFAMLLGATLAYSLAAWLVFERGLRRYCAGSRFGVMG